MDHQEQFEILKRLTWLQGFEVVGIEMEDPEENRRGKRVKLIRVRDRRKSHVCGQCGKAHREIAFYESEERRWRDRSVGDFETYLVIVPGRVLCCGGTRVERMPWEAGEHRMTRRFFDLIAGLCRRLPISEVAKMSGLSWDTVCRVDKASIEMALGGIRPSLDGLRWIGVDEVSRTGGHVYFTIVTDLKSGKVVWIGEGKKTESLASFFDELGRKRCRRLKGVISDLSPAYLAAIAAAAPHAIHLLDRFHVIKWVNEAVDAVRREEFGAAPRDDVGRALKVKKWMLLRAQELLGIGEKRLMNRLLVRNRKLQRAYLLKEELRGIFRYGWIYLGALRNALESWCRMAVRSRIEPMKKVGRRLREHLDKLIGGFEHAIKMGLVEAINGKIAQLRRRAHGYRDPEYFMLKIYQACSIHEDPFGQIVL